MAAHTQVYQQNELDKAVRYASKYASIPAVWQHRKTGVFIVTDDGDVLAECSNYADLYVVAWSKP